MDSNRSPRRSGNISLPGEDCSDTYRNPASGLSDEEQVRQDNSLMAALIGWTAFASACGLMLGWVLLETML